MRHSKPHIVHVVHWLRVAGLENGVVNLINRLHGTQQHTVVCVADTGPLANRLPADVEVIDLSRRFQRDVLFPWRLSRILRGLNPDIVHSRNWGTIDAVLAARLAGVAIAVHGEHGRESIDPLGRNRSRKVLRRVFAPMISRFVTVSDDLKRWLIADVGIPSDKVVRIHNGVDTERFAPGDRMSGRKALNVSEDQIVVGAVGRLDPVKDHMTLLEACTRIGNSAPRWQLIVIGEGELRADLEARVSRSDLRGRAILIGEHQDVPVLLRGLDVYVISSLAEGISNTLLEAMATGLPVVATRTGGNPEVVAEGVNGVLVPVGDADMMANALEAYIADAELRMRHGQASRKRSQDVFSLDRMAVEYDSLYTSLLQAHR